MRNTSFGYVVQVERKDNQWTFEWFHVAILPLQRADVYSYQNQQFDILLIDELRTSRDYLQVFAGRNRVTLEPCRGFRAFTIGTNPGVGHVV